MLSWRIAFPGNQLCSFRMSFPHLDMSAQEAGMINRRDRTVRYNNSVRGAIPSCSLATEFGAFRCKANKMGTMTRMLPEAYLSVYRVAVATWRFCNSYEEWSETKTLSHGCHYSGMGATNTWQPLLLQLVSFHAWRNKMHKRLICIVNLLVKYVCVLHFRWVKISRGPLHLNQC